MSGNRVYFYGYRYNDYFDKEYHLYRYTYKKKKNAFVKENLTSGIKKTFGDKVGDLVMTGTPQGAAIVGICTGSAPVHDTYFVKNGKKAVTPLSKAACYHDIFTPMAVYTAGRLYVLGINNTEPDSLFFRSTEL